MTVREEFKLTNGLSIIIIFLKIIVELHRKEVGQKAFKRVLKSSRIEWCKFVAGKSTENRFAKALIHSFKEKIPNLFHDCPYFGLIAIINATFSTKFVQIIPTSTYLLHVLITEPASKATIDIEICVEISNS